MSITKLLRATAVAVLFVAATGCKEETIVEKADVVKNDVVRGTTETVNRVQEATCAKSDAICLAREAKNRANEAGAAVKDAVTEVKNELD